MQNGKFLLVCWVEYYTLVFCGNTIFSSEVEAFSLSLSVYVYIYVSKYRSSSSSLLDKTLFNFCECTIFIMIQNMIDSFKKQS